MIGPHPSAIRRISFVCTGNICRSPMGDVILQHLEDTSEHPLGLEISSAGTGAWHVGDQADRRARAALARNNYDGERHRASHFTAESFARHDLVLGFDHGHIDELRALARTNADREKVQLLLPFAWQDDKAHAPADPEVHDPYFSDDAAFDVTIRLVDAAVRRIYARLQAAHASR